MHRLLSAPAVWLGWVNARLALAGLIAAQTIPFGDVRYYHRGVSGADPTAMTEYPDAGVWPVRVLGWLTGMEGVPFVVGFLVMCLLIDATFLAALLHRRHIRAGWFWVVFGLATGHVLWLRLDLFPGVLVAAAAALLFTRPRWAAAVLALAAAMKLWPAVLAAGLVGGARRVGTWVRVGVFGATLVGLAALTWATSGLDRLLRPVLYQGDRGIQIESLAATPSSSGPTGTRGRTRWATRRRKASRSTAPAPTWPCRWRTSAWPRCCSSHWGGPPGSWWPTAGPRG